METLFIHVHPFIPDTVHLKDAAKKLIGTFTSPEEAEKWCTVNNYKFKKAS